MPQSRKEAHKQVRARHEKDDGKLAGVAVKYRARQPARHEGEQKQYPARMPQPCKEAHKQIRNRAKKEGYAPHAIVDYAHAFFLFGDDDFSVFDFHVGMAGVAIVFLSVDGGFRSVHFHVAHDFVDEFCDSAFYYDARAVFVVNVYAVVVYVDVVAVVGVNIKRRIARFRLRVRLIFLRVGFAFAFLILFVRALRFVAEKLVETDVVELCKRDEIVRVGGAFRAFPFRYGLS